MAVPFLNLLSKKIGGYLTLPLNYVLEIIYPSACIICGRPTPCPKGACLFHDIPLETLFCPNCRKDLSSPAHVFCKRCGRVATSNSQSHRCSAGDYYFTSFRPLQFYRGITRALVLQMKRDHSKLLAKAIARLYCEERRDILEQFQPDCIVAVPMNWRRLFLRGGVNAPGVIAKKMAHELRIPCFSKYVKRIRSTAPQTSVDWDDRPINVYEAFEIYEPNIRFRLFLKKSIKRVLKNTWSLFPDARAKFKPIDRVFERFVKDKLSKKEGVFKGKRVIVLDDAFTTGSTVNEIARALLNAGASEVMAATIARAGLGKRRNKARL